MELLAPGGSLFIGDVRNLNLQSAFQTGIAAGPRHDHRRRRPRSANGSGAPVLGEPELLLAPEFFTTWAAGQPVGCRGRHPRSNAVGPTTSCNRYRYDVTLHKAPAPARSVAAVPGWTWAECEGLQGLRARG